MIIGYTSGTFDLFHVGHLRLLQNAKSNCDSLIVGVSTDDLVFSYKGYYPVIPFTDRVEIVRAIKYVDRVVTQDNLCKLTPCLQYEATLLFVGDDWKDTEAWNAHQEKLNRGGIQVRYLPYTPHVSTTTIKKKLRKSTHGTD